MFNFLRVDSRGEDIFSDSRANGSCIRTSKKV